MSSRGIKTLGVTDGVRVLELVRCQPLFPDDKEGEDVLATDYRNFPLWCRVTVLINRIILNNHLLQPKPRKRYEPDSKVTKVGNDIALELERDDPNEEYIIEKTIEMASLMYEQSNAKLNLTVSIAQKLTQTMVTQDEFNRDYFTALASHITLGEQGRVILHTKTETEVTLDDGSN